MRITDLRLVVAFALTSLPTGAMPVSPAVGSACSLADTGSAADTASREALHCVLLAPAPDLRSATGVLELRPVPGPFGATVTASGAPRYLLVATIAGLPPTSSLGNYKAYVAWSFSVTMDSATKLGEVRNGETVLGEVAREQFRVLITAEPSGTVTARGGRLVMRATSPGARLLAHRDLMQPIAPGASVASDAPAAPAHQHGVVPSGATGRALVWRMPPMPSAGSMTMPGMGGLSPAVAPWLPRVPNASTVTPAVPRRVVTLRDGDTLALVASMVSRTINGRRLLMYAFNGQYPGPLLRATEGSTVVVRFENRLDQPSAVHWHGVRLENRSDGVPGLTQPEVAPGGRFQYRVHFRDAGIYWYHPHVREDIQQDLGLYGNILVSSPRGDDYPPADREEVLALDDILLDETGTVPYGATAPTHALMGRWGNVFLVNGEPRWSLRVSRGDVVRFYLTNVSSARVFNLAFAGARVKVVASDGGRFEREVWARSVVIAPAERYVVDVRFDRAGSVALTNEVQALDHMYGTYAAESDTLGIVSVTPASATSRQSGAAEAFERLRGSAAVAGLRARYHDAFDRAPDRTLVLDMRANDLPRPVALMLNGLNVPMDWNDGMGMANWVTTAGEVTWILRDADSRRENMQIDGWRFRLGDVVKLRIFNDPLSPHAMAHPIHVHGQRFLVLSRNGVRNDNLVWKDTGIIPAGETVDLLVEMSNPGAWLLHCHIAEHMGAGMMMRFDVTP
jgi:suppressor of ftsI